MCSIEESNNLDTLTLDEMQISLLFHEQRMTGNVEEEQVLKVSGEEEQGVSVRGRGGRRGGFRGVRGRARCVNTRETVECFNCHQLGHDQAECANQKRNANYAHLDVGE